ncbi:carboxypeptidase S [Lactarius akahatsu]|uniref:Carboxypeptidase S n=1 Tax=Lactarius akahatsu TaxID=416441 RepID=A0AAD4LU19_9AGAM|nr:carboxypeptidase S [Lactarius akahatsu]
MTNCTEKGFPLVTVSVSERRPQRPKWRMLVLVSLLVVPADILYPDRNALLWDSLGKYFSQDAFTSRAVEWLGGAVRVPTESYDNMDPIGVDERWEAFRPFHDYIFRSFPLIHETLTLTKVNTYGLLYEWKGSAHGLKPLLLAAHQDVVPVDPKTVNQWKYPPYSGNYDGEFIWGRGSSDDKSGLIGILSSVETLLEKNFKPARTIILAFGFDEEASGLQGAGTLSQVLLKKYGEGSFALLVDEGSGFSEIGGTVIAVPGIAEKGYIDAMVTVSTVGGHSSIPPPHTSIGLLSRLLVEFEANPIKPQLDRASPVYSNVQCVGQHAKEFPAHLRALIKTSINSDWALYKLETELIKDETYKSLIGTTQAIDLIQGGVKSNALPEGAWAVVNHRIATQSSVAAVQQHDTNILKHLANEFNLSFTAFGLDVTPDGAPSAGKLTLTEAWESGLEPAPVTPTDEDSAPWQLLSGTIKATYNAHRGLEGADNIFVSPGVMSGNTDTRYYWKLTPHIVRYNHKSKMDNNAPHTVNEHIRAESFVEMIRFFTTLILNVDEATSL